MEIGVWLERRKKVANVSADQKKRKKEAEQIHKKEDA